MRTITPAGLRTLIRSIFVATGAPEDIADEVAVGLVENNLAGHDSHGLLRVPQYYEAINKGTIVPDARPEVVHDGGATAVVSGNWTFGQVAGNAAADVAIDRALAHGVAAVSLVDANHTGRLALFTERGVDRHVVMFMTSGSGAGFSTVPYGGTQASLGTNPIAFTLPRGDGPPVTLDYATSAIAAGKIKVARSRGEPLPDGATVNRAGEPTTDPNDYFDGGSLLPFGGHKGYALSVIAELLSGPLAGQSQKGDTTRRRTGCFLFAVHAGAFRSVESYDEAVAETAQRLTSVPPAEGFEKVLLPGELEARSRATREQEGIPVPDRIWDEIQGIGEALGLELDIPA